MIWLSSFQIFTAKILMQIEAVRLKIPNLAFTNFVVFLCYKNIVLDDEESEMS